jgi:hypothetical protein
LAIAKPDNEIRHRRNAAQFPQPRRILPAMIVTVHGRLRQRMSPADLYGRLEPRNFNYLFHAILIRCLQQLIQLFETLPRVRFQIRHGREVFYLLEGEARRPRTRDPQKPVLHLMNVKQSFTDCLVADRCRMRLKRPLVLCIGPLLVGVKFVEV